MLIAQLLFNDIAARKLARRGIALGEVEQLPRNRAVVIRNPRPRTAGARLLIGESDGGRLLTVVIEPDPADTAVWHVRTGWDANLRERRVYQRGR